MLPLLQGGCVGSCAHILDCTPPSCLICHVAPLQKLKKLLKIAAEEQEAARAKGDADRKDGTAGPEARADPLPMTAQEKEFISTLNKDLSRINAYFMEREEDAVIKLQTLVDRKLAAEAAGASLQEGEAEALRSAFVDFHGELVLLLHWSLVNYAGVVKILKKHDKLLGGHAQGVYLANVLHQPFTSTESISRLVRDTEAQVRSVATLWHAQVSGAAKRSKASVSRSQKEATVLK